MSRRHVSFPSLPLQLLFGVQRRSTNDTQQLYTPYIYTEDLITMTRRVRSSCLRAACDCHYTGDLILIIIVVTGIVVLSIVGPHNVYTAFTTARGSLVSLLGVPEYGSADWTFLACTTAEPGPSYWNRIKSNQCKGRSRVLLKAMLHHDLPSQVFQSLHLVPTSP